VVKISLVPTDRRFFDLLARSARTLVIGSEALQDFFEHYENPEFKAERIRELEHQADFITHEVMAQLHRTFITPIDREDIANLIQRMDDVMDFMEEASTAMHIYRIRRSRQRAVEVARLMPKMTGLIEQSVQLLSAGALKQILPLTVEINSLENQADTIFRAAMSELFDEEANPAEIIKWREIYSDLESATDSAEDVANVLEGVVLKYA
jgi:predicted phosphate transport protein (TIGR00153 family)